MRTTLTLDDEAFHKAQAYAHARSLKLGQAVSELIQRGTADKLPMKRKNGIWVFELPPGTPRVTARQVKDLMDDPA
ncbi:MAG: hypothetical protein AVDCRST_MAG51-1537 [uncultured Ramlibacter sp.]|uniref:DUF2191 domain-containing protein n=1 Tax=uncultured Ramlibacter sp. TaxID=260755 RepID=A0A6J4PK03_9BURK|nr:MAG: hypothetical protein AVDCRST_MAG51-1537 [uncultured Ramlibacter sp.]